MNYNHPTTIKETCMQVNGDTVYTKTVKDAITGQVISQTIKQFHNNHQVSRNNTERSPFVDRNDQPIYEKDDLRFDNGHIYTLIKKDSRWLLVCMSKAIVPFKAEMFAYKGKFLAAKKV